MSTETVPVDVQEDQLMLTTIDNPFNPKTEYDDWKEWDTYHGHYTEEYIARLVSMEKDFDVDDEYSLELLISKVVQDILAQDSEGLYRLA